MARTTGLHAFTVQEATNYEAFTSWNFQAIDVSGDAIDDPGVTATYITSADPAKKVILYDKGGLLEAADSISITLNGETDANKVIIVDGSNLPFTLSGLTITSFKITIPDADTTADEELGLISFH